MSSANKTSQSVLPHQSFSSGYRAYVLALLTLGYVFNFVDRQVMTILLEPIKAEFDASDAQMGLLSGLAFALFYATLGIPVARLADRWSRRNVLAISMATWSVVTALCSTASSFVHLALLRIGVGIGEAGGSPPSQSLITDYFPPERRAFAQGVFAIAPNIGILVGLFGGALIAEALGWRAVFLVFGLPGVALSVLLYLTLKEPLRPPPDPLDRSLWSALGDIVKLPGFAWVAAGVGFAGISGYGLGVWSPSFLVRVHGMTLVDAGLWLGLIGVFFGGLGTVISGMLVDRLSQRNPHWQLWVPAIGCLIALPTQLAFLLLPETLVFQLGDTTVPVALLFMMLSALFAASWVAPSYAAVQNLVPPHWRTQASALLLLTLNLLGMGLGPLAVGLLSDWFSDMGVQSIRYALAVTVSTCILGSLCYWYGSGAYASAIGADRSLKRLKQ